MLKNKIVEYKNKAINATKEQKWRIDGINLNATKLQNEYRNALGAAPLGQISAFGQTRISDEVRSANRVLVDTRELTNAIEGQKNIANQAYQDALKANSDDDRLAKEAAERERLAKEAAERLAKAAADAAKAAADAAARAAREAADATARAKAKADAKAEWDAAQKAANDAQINAEKALAFWVKQKAEYAAATDAIPPLKLVYDNAAMVVDNASIKKSHYDDAVSQQTVATSLLKLASELLEKANAKSQSKLDKIYQELEEFIKQATVFPNGFFGINNEYNAMSIDWAAYNAAKAELASTDAKKIVETTTATDKLVAADKKFNTSKNTYAGVVIPSIKSSQVDSDYIKNNKMNADIFEAVYGLSKPYGEMADAWRNVLKSMDVPDVYATLVNYNQYLILKTIYANALLIAQGKRTEAEFQEKLAAGRAAANKWTKSGTNGCRNIQTTATTDQNMLDQDIACNDTEYVSGYSTVTGFEAAPADQYVTSDNIGRYLAVKYSCCTAPSGPKGPKGKKGLPGLGGMPGLAGPEGPDGMDGPQGKKGAEGEMGKEGGKGPRGEMGDDGIDGPQGFPGKPGKTVTAPLIKQVPGPMGNEGEMGPMGIRGPKGKDGTILSAPASKPSELDRTIELLDIKKKISTYLYG